MLKNLIYEWPAEPEEACIHRSGNRGLLRETAEGNRKAHRYDTTIKDLVAQDIEQFLPILLEGATYQATLNEESQLAQRIRIRAKAEAEASVKAEAAAMIKDAQARGKAEGRAEGEAKGLREAMISMIRIRFPRLAAEAATSQQLEQITAPEALRELYEQLLRAANEAEAQQLLSSPSA